MSTVKAVPQQMTDIERRSKVYSERRAALEELVAAFNAGLAELRAGHLPGIKKALERAAQAQADLQAVVKDAPDLFQKPRTVIFHGIKVGFEKGKGAITFEDSAAVVALIKKHLPDLVDVLIKTKQTPNKAGLATLDVRELKRVGCTVQDAGDQVVIRPVDSEVDKTVAALLKSAQDNSSDDDEDAE